MSTLQTEYTVLSILVSYPLICLSILQCEITVYTTSVGVLKAQQNSTGSSIRNQLRGFYIAIKEVHSFK